MNCPLYRHRSSPPGISIPDKPDKKPLLPNPKEDLQGGETKGQDP